MLSQASFQVKIPFYKLIVCGGFAAGFMSDEELSGMAVSRRALLHRGLETFRRSEGSAVSISPEKIGGDSNGRRMSGSCARTVRALLLFLQPHHSALLLIDLANISERS